MLRDTVVQNVGGMKKIAARKADAANELAYPKIGFYTPPLQYEHFTGERTKNDGENDLKI